MASERKTWGFKPNAEQVSALESYMAETEDANKSDALAHYVNEGIRRKQERVGGPRSLPTLLLNGVVQMSVLAIVVLMLGPGLNIIRARTATLVGVGLLAAAFWLLVAIRYDWISSARNRVGSHLAWVRQEAET